MLRELPGWVVDDVTSVHEEVARWARMSAIERWRLARACSRDAIWAARVSGRRKQILETVDPLPDSTVKALERQRREAGWYDADG